MKPVDEQLALIKQGAHEIIREEELKHKLEGSLKTGIAAEGQSGL